jgi:dipeptidyl aminopeptidase/acylaminoacyl peptidase
MDASQPQAVASFCLAAALVVFAGVAATSPSAWAAFEGLNGQLAYKATGGVGPSVFAIQPFLGSLDNETKLTGDDGANTQAAWSADGRKIAFVSDRDGNENIYVMDADGTNERRLTENPASDFYPTWSPGPSGSARIAFTSTRDNDREIYVMNADGSDQTRLTFVDGVDQRPDWFPKGPRIAFESSRDGNYELYAMEADGAGQTRLTFHGAPDTEASWKPNGKILAFSSGEAGAADIFAFRTRQGRRRHRRGRHRLIGDRRDDHNPAWSPDGRQMAFTGGRFTYVKKLRKQEDSIELVAAGVDAAWGPLQRPDGLPEPGATVSIKPLTYKEPEVRVPGAAMNELERATDIPVRSVIDTEGAPAKIEIATGGRESTELIVSKGRARFLQNRGSMLGGVLRLPILDCKGADATTEQNALRVHHPRPAASSSIAQERPKARAAHHPHRPHVNAGHQHTSSPRTDWMVLDSCERTETHVFSGVVDIVDLVTGRHKHIGRKKSPYITLAP